MLFMPPAWLHILITQVKSKTIRLCRLDVSGRFGVRQTHSGSPLSSETSAACDSYHSAVLVLGLVTELMADLQDMDAGAR